MALRQKDSDIETKSISTLALQGKPAAKSAETLGTNGPGEPALLFVHLRGETEKKKWFKEARHQDSQRAI